MLKISPTEWELILLAVGAGGLVVGIFVFVLTPLVEHICKRWRPVRPGTPSLARLGIRAVSLLLILMASLHFVDGSSQSSGSLVEQATLIGLAVVVSLSISHTLHRFLKKLPTAAEAIEKIRYLDKPAKVSPVWLRVVILAIAWPLVGGTLYLFAVFIGVRSGIWSALASEGRSANVDVMGSALDRHTVTGALFALAFLAMMVWVFVKFVRAQAGGAFQLTRFQTGLLIAWFVSAGLAGIVFATL